MNDIQKIQTQLEKISSLESTSPYGTEYQLWDKAVETPIRNLFGDEAVKLFKQQESVIIPLDHNEWKQQYIGDLGKKKHVLEEFLSNPQLYRKSRSKKDSRSTEPQQENLLSKIIWGFLVVIAAGVIVGLILHITFGIG
ncbi:MAG: hypothetical protein P4M11_05725 [Candidatus Pacebacteria bacterium]|nr:hypothetical protein [Candidatus Paceibacterota bacterium]